MTPLVSVIIPTVTGREKHLARCLTAYQARSAGHELELIVIKDLATCGLAWNAGAEQAHGDFLHWTADDLEPCQPWLPAAIETVRAGAIPAPVVIEAAGGKTEGGYWDRTFRDGQETDNTCTVPFIDAATWATIGPHLTTHYYNDNYFTDRCREAGRRVLVRQDYRFIHHSASEGRKPPSQMDHDRAIYEQT